ncbi:hypothetical protein PsorP6_012397 [Peronosclerospora sorghi]|uniref:Uncharacterized protein n=1 Tax=Peronosclerospora sorghi TaxID=230839 RepID=A0ACC0WHJ5_9STRA|nr:hypothetical protein PsorP6_012397 [Peronosclerospora sorghi]
MTRHMSPKQQFLPLLQAIEEHVPAGAKTDEDAVDIAGASSSSSSWTSDDSSSDDFHSSSSSRKLEIVFATSTTNFVKKWTLGDCAWLRVGVLFQALDLV